MTGDKTNEIASTGFRSALDTLHCSSVIIDINGHPLYYNQSAKELFLHCGMSIEEFIDILKKQINLTYGQGRFTIVAKEITFVCNVYPWVADDKRIGSTLILHEEMHPDCSFMEMRLFSDQLNEINAVLEAAYDGMIITNSTGTIVRINTAAEKVLATKRRDMLGRNVKELMQEQVFDDSAALKVIETLTPTTVVVNTKAQKQLLVTGTPVLDEVGNLNLVVINLRDLSELNDLRRSLEQQKMMTEAYQRELTKLTRQLPNGMVATSHEMLQILDQIEALAQVDATVLITGESGVGKEVIVNRIHSTSNRNQMPIIKINCGAIPDSLFETEMFGYEEGSFTGAKKKGKAGFFEMANGGTLFLDEIGELRLDMQVKLLRVLQEKELTRVGGTNSIHIDVRILAATNRDLWELTQKGEFRQDLYYRLNVINLEIPPLRDRRDDILPLAMAFLDKYNRKYKKKKTISLELGKMLRRLDWPGNIRELENLIENLVLLVRDEDSLKPYHLPARYHTAQPTMAGVTIHGILPLKEAFSQVEDQLLLEVRSQYSTTREMAAALGVNQSTISRKLKALKDKE